MVLYYRFLHPNGPLYLGVAALEKGHTPEEVKAESEQDTPSRSNPLRQSKGRSIKFVCPMSLSHR